MWLRLQRLLSDGLVCRIRKILSGIDVQSQSMTGAGFGQSTLNGLVDIGAFDSLKRDGLISSIHDGKILDVLKVLNRDADFNPASAAVSEVVPTIWTFIDGVRSVRIMGFDDLPRPCPREVSQVALPLRVLIAVHCVVRREN